MRLHIRASFLTEKARKGIGGGEWGGGVPVVGGSGSDASWKLAKLVGGVTTDRQSDGKADSWLGLNLQILRTVYLPSFSESFFLPLLFHFQRRLLLLC